MNKTLPFLLISFFVSIVVTAQVANQPSDLMVCDDDNDGFSTFDLSQQDFVILGTQNPLNFSLAYYETIADAENNVNPIANAFAYMNIVADAQVIYARLENLETGNADLTNFYLFVNPSPTPVLDPDDLILCDETNTGDGQEVFDLTINEASIINGEFGVTASYYETQENAELANTPIADPTQYTNMNTPVQTIYMRVENSNSGCFTVVNFDILVNPMPFVNLDPTYELCNGGTLILDTGLSTDNFNFYWSTGETTAAITVNTADTYSVTVTDSNAGCIVTETTIVSGITCVDSDSDGVFDMDEDINNNGNLEDDDTDGDGTPNYLDDDDDGDNVPTDVEVNIESGRSDSATSTIIDTDGDLIENYLDDDDDGDGIWTIYEDYNNNGDPTDDDTNNNSVPDYLDLEVALSIDTVSQSLFKIYPNPATDAVHVTFQKEIQGMVVLRVIDLQGKVVLDTTRTPNNHTVTLTLKGLQSGVYLLNVEWQASRLVKRLIIQ